MGAPNFWDNQELAKPIISELKQIKAAIDPIEGILREIDDVRALYELGEEAGDSASLEEADKQLASGHKTLQMVNHYDHSRPVVDPVSDT